MAASEGFGRFSASDPALLVSKQKNLLLNFGFSSLTHPDKIALKNPLVSEEIIDIIMAASEGFEPSRRLLVTLQD